MSWTLGNVFGIPVRLHFTMVLVPFLIFNQMSIHSMLDIFEGGVIVVLLFGSVLLHELGHALTARRYGIHTRDIVLTPLGGIARIVSMPQNPWQEIIIAVAGPLVSLSLAGLSLVSYIFLAFMPVVTPIFLEILGVLVGTNLLLAVFNLIPALPMDGGRVLRGILALKRDHLTATRMAARFGRALAVVGAFVAFTQENITLGGLTFGSLSLGLIAVFIYIAAGSEVRMAEMRDYEERMRSGRGGFGDPFSFGGMPRRGRVWTWDTRRGATGASPFGQNAPQGTDAYRKAEDWSKENERSDPNVVVVTGKAEIVGRKD